MTKEQVLAQQRADFAVAKFIEEILVSGHIKEYTFDETRDSALECAKQNIEASSLTEREKYVAKESVDKTIHEIYTMLSGIEEDPDFHKIATSTLVKFKLRQDFNIPID